MTSSAGFKFREALKKENPLQIVGTINAFSALLAEHAGFHAIYLSGAGVANASHGLPDLGFTSLEEVLEDARRITNTVELPLLVDVDTGFTIKRTVKEMINAGVAGIHIEDQENAKRCGHRPGKKIISTEEMLDRIKTAVDAKTDSNFIIMARTDALAIEGFNATLDRISRYIEAGAEMIFFEGATELSQYQTLTQRCNVPVLANITEFGVTPLFTVEELKKAGVQLILYPLTAFRAMNAAALNVYSTLRKEGTQKNIISTMQTREELYSILNYYEYEQKMDAKK